jgi:hypothetical protein
MHKTGKRTVGNRPEALGSTGNNERMFVPAAQFSLVAPRRLPNHFPRVTLKFATKNAEIKHSTLVVRKTGFNRKPCTTAILNRLENLTFYVRILQLDRQRSDSHDG